MGLFSNKNKYVGKHRGGSGRAMKEGGDKTWRGKKTTNEPTAQIPRITKDMQKDKDAAKKRR